MVNIEKQKCPNCGQMVDFLVTDHTRIGILNACVYCTTGKVRSLHEIQAERKKKDGK